MTMRSSLSVHTTRSNAMKEALTGYKAFNTTCMSKSLNALAGSVPNKRNRTLEHILGKIKSPIECIGLKAQRNSLCMASTSRQQRRGFIPEWAVRQDNHMPAKTRLLASAMVDVRSQPSRDRPLESPSSKYCLIAASGLSRYRGIRS